MSDYHLRFDGYVLVLYNGPDYIDSWVAISGRPGYQSPALMRARNIGPIPEGSWSFKLSNINIITGLDNAIGSISPIISSFYNRIGLWPGGKFSWV